MNRQQRRSMSRGKKATGVAGISLVAFTGLFGGYMGGGRPSRAYAAPNVSPAAAPACSNIIPITDETTWRAAVSSSQFTNPSGGCVTLSIENSFSVTQRSPRFRADLISGPVSVSVVGKVVNGVGPTVSGALANANSEATFLDIYLTSDDTLYVSDLTTSGMQAMGSSPSNGAAIRAVTRNGGQSNVVLDHVTVENGNPNPVLGYLRGQVLVNAKALISYSTFRDNKTIATPRPNGNQAAAGAAVMLYGALNGSRIVGSTFSNNVASATISPNNDGWLYGAALTVLQGSPTDVVTIERSTFSGNSVNSLGNSSLGYAIGGAVSSGSALLVRDSVFTNNSAIGGRGARGGAIFMGLNWYQRTQGANLTIERSSFSGNQVVSRSGDAIGGAVGGGMQNVSQKLLLGDVAISATTFSGNSATALNGSALGGALGMLAHSSTNRFSLVNSTFTDDTTSGSVAHRGGAIYAKTAPLSVDFSTITGNTSGDGGGIFSTADDTITNSIVNLNTAVYASDASSTGTTRADHSIFTVAPPGGSVIAATFTPGPDTLFTNTPQVDALADNGGFTLPGGARIQTMALRSGVAARGGGTATPASGVWPANDQRGPGFPRVLQCTVSMGALAAVGPNPPCPAAPTNLAATPGNAQASIAFAPAVAGSSPITNYEYTLDDSTWIPLNPSGTSSPVTIPGLTNGQTYSVRLRAVSSAGAGNASTPVSVTPSAPPPPPPPVYPPSAPLSVTATPSNASATVSWTEPADSGSFPVTDYVVTAGPGGKTCLASAPALSCTVTGLTNGTAYTFVVKALNGAGWGPESAASPAVTPTGRDLTLDQGQRVAEGDMDRITATGTTTGLPAGAKLTPYIRYGDDGEFVKGDATIVVRPDGTYTWSRLVHQGKAVTAYVVYEDLTSNRVTWGKASPRSLTLFQGKRTADGMHDRIRTGGTSVGVPEGALLTPWIRYGDSGSFVEGVASIVVDAQGNFVWTREIRKDKKFTAYVAYEDLESNRVVWKRVR